MIGILITFLVILLVAILAILLYFILSYNRLISYGNRIEEARVTYDNMRTRQEATLEDIAMARRYYNAVVKEYNDKLMAFPNNVIGAMFQFQRMNAFEETESEREL